MNTPKTSFAMKDDGSGTRYLDIYIPRGTFIWLI